MDKRVLRGRCFFEGAVCLKYRIELPPTEVLGRAEALYLSLAESCERFCREELSQRLGGARECGCYTLSLQVTRSDGCLLCVSAQATLKVRGRVIGEWSRRIFHSPEDGMLLPASIVKKRMKKGDEKSKKTC